MLRVVREHPLRAANDGVDGAPHLAALDHLHVHDLRFRCNAKRRSRHSTSHGGAVRVTQVVFVGERVVAAPNASNEIRMRLEDAAVEHVHRHTKTAAVVLVRAIQWQSALIDTVERERNRTRFRVRSG